MPITKPAVDAADYLEADSEDIQPKVGTTVQKGWDAVDDRIQTSAVGDFPTDFRFTEEPQLIKFLEDEPFAVYEQHWIERPKGKKSFVCVGEDCPMCDILGDKPRGKFAFNITVLSGDVTGVQILTAPPLLVRQLRKINEDDRKGPLSREFWEVSRLGTGPTTSYNLNYVRGRDLEEEWKLSDSVVQELVASAVPFTAEVIRETPRSEMKEIARSIA
jgi:hypothetical protein